MSWEPIYYPDHAERYAHLGKRERLQYPDAIDFGGGVIYVREKKLSEMTFEDRSQYGHDGVLYAAVDVPLWRAEVWH
jgi:hypothetical protein